MIVREVEVCLMRFVKYEKAAFSPRGGAGRRSLAQGRAWARGHSLAWLTAGFANPSKCHKSLMLDNENSSGDMTDHR